MVYGIEALKKSMPRAAVRVAGLFWLKPVATRVDSGRRVVVVECLDRKASPIRFNGVWNGENALGMN